MGAKDVNNYHLITLCILINPKIKELLFICQHWSKQNITNLILFSHAKQRTMRLRDGLEHDMYCAYRVTRHAVGRLQLDNVKQMAFEWVGWQVTRKVVTK